jgi:hypothetical protein
MFSKCWHSQYCCVLSHFFCHYGSPFAREGRISLCSPR